MRIREFMLGKPESGSPALHHTTPPDRMNGWYALLSTYQQLLTRTLQTNYISGNRTPGTNTLCAIVPARRLYEN